MYFIPYHSKLFSYAAHMSRKNRYILTGALASFLLLGWYGAYYFMDQQIQNDQRLITQLHNQYQQLCQTEHSCDIQKKHTQSLQDQFSKYSFAAEADFNQHQLDEILTEAKKQSVRVAEISIIKQIAKPWYQRQDLQVSLVGPFTGITAMLAALKRNGQMIECKQFACQRTKDSLYSVQCQLRAISSPQ
jgi:hypothetical protein